MRSRGFVSQVASSVPFDNTGTDLSSDNVQDAIVEAAAPNFSYNVIVTGMTLTIPQYQQMVVHDEIDIQGTGELITIGDLAVIT